MTIPDLPPQLIASVQEQRAILFLGAGASIDAFHPKSETAPSGDKLRDKLCDKFLGGALKDRPLTAVAAMAASEAGLTHVQKFIRDLFIDFGPADFHLLIPTFRWRAIATTNFDLIIERAYEKSRGAVQRIVKTVKDGDLFDTRMNQESDPVGLMKLHGCIDHYTDETIPLILGQEQYASYAANRTRFYDRLRDLAYENPIIFCGYSISDPHIQQLLFDLTDRTKKRPMYYYVAPNITDIETRYWAGNHVACIRSTMADLLATLDKKISVNARRLRRDVSADQLSLFSHFKISGATPSDALRFYVENDVVHLHSGLVVSRQDSIEFYKGYDRGFGCIAQDLDIRRPVTDSVLVDAILLDEEARKNGEFFLVRGPGGNGKTVALKRVAWEAGRSYDKISLYVDSPAGLRFEPLEEIFQLTGKRIFLFVDRVALVRDELVTLLRTCRSRKLPLTVVGAERENEWHIYCEALEPFASQDFPVAYLSKDEIIDLLKKLEEHRALGLLAERTEEERVDAFLNRAERQLLVALHETTLGIPFETIVLDEYSRIKPPEAQTLYLDIAALHQFGAPVRAGLVSRAAGITFAEFGSRFLKPLADVVLVDEGKRPGDVFYRSRHQHVAELVFNQALPHPEDKYDLLANLIHAMNIDYSSDRETFSRLVRGRSVVAMFPNVELGRLLYDRAEEAARNEYFVAHQRAVFELHHPNGELSAAEEAAKRAALLNPNSRSVRHTQAEIARRQALNTADPLRKQSYRRVARERLTGDMARLSEYDLYTRAKVAIDELRELIAKLSDSASATALVTATREAETAIEKGRTEFPQSAEILAAEADLRDVLDQAPKALAALERAFSLNPRQDWLAVRLAKRYQASGDDKKALEVVQRCLKENPDSKAAHLRAAHLIRRSAGDKDRILEHLRKSFAPGDNNFEGQFWYAREIYLRGRTAEAKTLFDNVNERAPGRFRTESAAEYDNPDGSPISLDASVLRKEEGYAFVRLIDLGVDLFASRADSARIDWDRIRTGTQVRCYAAFNRRGARATHLTVRRT